MSPSYETEQWKIYVPSVDQAGSFSLVFATENIKGTGLPDTKLQTLPLAPGEHLIELKGRGHSDRDSQFLVTLDGRQIANKTHPPDWYPGGGTSESGAQKFETSVTPRNELTTLLRRRTMQTTSPNSWSSTPKEIPAKGVFLGIIPDAQLKTSGIPPFGPESNPVAE